MKKLLVSLLCVMMVMCMMPAMAFADGEVAKIGDTPFISLDAAVAEASTGDEIEILVAGTYTIPAGLDITITGAVPGVVFDNIGAKNMGGASVTFKNVTFDYYPNTNYTGLQHSGTLVYEDCTFNGQVFLYGESETFNGCTFNQNSSDAYNVWTYGAKKVTFEGCTFNSAGKSVLIYSEDKNLFNDVAVADCEFIASASVDGKAAIEMDSSLTAGINLTIDSETTATGFDSGNVSGNSLWNNKKGSEGVNNDIKVTVAGETVLKSTFVAQIGTTKYEDLHEAMTAAKSGDTVELIGDVDLAGTEWEPVSFKGAFNGNGYVIKNLTINKPGVSNTGFITSLNGAFENVTFTNPTVTGGPGTAVVAGRAGGPAALAKNITVNGTIKVESTVGDSYGYARTGVIVGGWAYGNYENITVDGGDKAVSYVKHTGSGDGRYVAGIVGHADDVDSYINCTVKNITISGGWLCGGIAGPGPSDGQASGCSVENVDINADYSGGMFGWYYGNGTIEDSTIKDVTFTAAPTNNGAIGGYSDNPNANVDNVTIENVKNADGTPLLVCEDVHKVEAVAKVNPTYSSVGTEAHYACKVCGTLYSDAAGETVITADSLVIPKLTLPAGSVSIEKPEITVDDGAEYTLNILGTTLKIAAKEGYELVDVTLNGVSQGAVAELKGLETGDMVVIVTKAIEAEEPADDVQLVARSEMGKAKGKKAIKIYWYAEDGSELNFDGYEIFRSTKRFKGYGTKPIFTTEREVYWNTAIEEGVKYFYKVRGYNVVDGEKVYGDWSLKAWRTAE